MSEAGESTTERQTPTAERQTPTAEQQTPTAQQTPTSPQQRLQLQTPSSPSMPRSNISEGGGEQISFRPGMPSYPRSAMGDARNSMGDFAPRERRLSGLSGMSTPEHRYARRTPFQMEYSSRRWVCSWVISLEMIACTIKRRLQVSSCCLILCLGIGLIHGVVRFDPSSIMNCSEHCDLWMFSWWGVCGMEMIK